MKHLFICALLLIATNALIHSQKLIPYSSYVGGSELKGYRDERGHIVVPAKYTDAGSFVNGLAKVERYDEKINRKYGFIDETGKEVIPLIYSYTSYDFSENLIGVQLKDKWGFIDRQGKTIIPFKYDYVNAEGFKDGLAGVMLNRKYGFIDKTGTVKVPFNYDDCKAFRNGLAAVKFNNKWGYVDATGKITIPINYSDAIRFSGGLAGVEYNDKWAVINKEGKLLTSFKYDDVHYNYSAKDADLIKVSTYNADKPSHKYGVVDKKGNEVIPVNYYTVDIYSNDLVVVKNESEKAGLVNSRNKVLLPVTYPGIYINNNKNPIGTLFETPNVRRIFSVDGDKVKIWKYEDVKDEYEGRRAVRYKNKWVL